MVNTACKMMVLRKSFGKITGAALIVISLACLVASSGAQNQTSILPSQASAISSADRQLNGPQCGIAGVGGNDPFGLQAQFLRVTLPPSPTQPSADARIDPLLSQNSSGGLLPLVSGFPPRGSGSGPVSNDIFFAALGPILESDSILNGTGVGNGKRHVIPRILKKRAAPTVSVQTVPALSREVMDESLHIALPNQLCWQVQIRTQIRLSTSRFAVSTCAGAIVGSRTILTAAHCSAQEFSSDDISVRIGSQSADTCDKPDASRCGESFRVSKLVRHPGYNSVLGDNDLAVLVLDKPIDFASQTCACTLCLQNSVPSVGETCVVSGFGDNLTIGNYSTFPLKWTQLKTQQASLTTSACGFNVDESTGKTSNLDLFLCAGGTKGESSCQGDSGGPLVCYNQATSSHYLAGIAAFGPPCGVNIGAMHTNIAKYLPWIVENSGSDVVVSIS